MGVYDAGHKSDVSPVDMRGIQWTHFT